MENEIISSDAQDTNSDDDRSSFDEDSNSDMTGNDDNNSSDGSEIEEVQEIRRRLQERKRRETIMKATMKYIPDHVDFNDGCVLVTLLYDIGFLETFFEDIVKPNTFACFSSDWNTMFFQLHADDSYCRVECNDGRITKLRLCLDEEYAENLDTFPSVIERLDKLKSISFDYDRSMNTLPVEIGNLRYLTHLDLTELTMDVLPVDLILPALEKLWFAKCRGGNEESMVSILNACGSSLTHLGFCECEIKDCVVSSLQNAVDIRFFKKLESLTITSSELESNHLEQLLLHVAPRFQNLSTLDLSYNKIERIPNIQRPNTSLCCLDLCRNPISEVSINVGSVGEAVDNQNMQTKAVVIFLQRFSTVYNLGLGNNLGSGMDFVSIHQYHPIVEKQLRLNYLQQSIVKGGTVISDDVVPFNNKPSLWPLILERAYKDSCNIYKKSILGDTTKQESSRRCPTAMFLILRDLPLSKYQIDVKKRKLDAI